MKECVAYVAMIIEDEIHFFCICPALIPTREMDNLELGICNNIGALDQFQTITLNLF